MLNIPDFIGFVPTFHESMYADRPPRGTKKKENYGKAIQIAIERGFLKKRPCQKCGSDVKVYAHHECYMIPFQIIWLCQQCHSPIGITWRYDDLHTSQTPPVIGVILLFSLPNIASIGGIRDVARRMGRGRHAPRYSPYRRIDLYDKE